MPIENYVHVILMMVRVKSSSLLYFLWLHFDGPRAKFTASSFDSREKS